MRIYEYASKTSNDVHKTTVHDDGRITCTCRGFNSPKGCWHVRDVAASVSAGITDTPAMALKRMAASQQTLFEANGDDAWIDPMLASALPEDLSIANYCDGAWILEEKYDGHRICLVITDLVTAYSRQGNVKTLPAHLREACKLLPKGTYDGELYIPGMHSTDVTALHLQQKLKIVLFDMLRVGSLSAMDKPSQYRRQLLETATEFLEGDAITVAPQFTVSAEGLQKIWDRGGEGAVIKKSCTYRAGKRAKEWIKFKKEQIGRGRITGFKAGKEAGSTEHSIIVAVDRAGIEVRMKSLNDEWRAAFATRSHEVIGKTIVFNYQEKTRDGRYRHPMADHIEDWKV